jgi:hypothetical protein
MTNTSVGAELLNEIERVSGIRQLYISLRGTTFCNVEPAIRMMTTAIGEANIALQSDDVASAICALEDLRGFTE